MNTIKVIGALAFCSVLLSSCKIMPTTIRSDARNAEVYKLLESGSLKFARSADGTNGEFSFKLKDRHSCRIEYWAADPTGRPSPSSPMSLDCPAESADNVVKLQIQNITSGIPLTFRVHVWPRTLTFLTSLSVEFMERPNLDVVQAGYLVVSRYMGPRNSNEIYTYQFPKATSLGDVKKSLQFKGAPGEDSCTANDQDEEQPYPRYKSQNDPKGRPLHGLGVDVTTDGYGYAAASTHPFFSTRLTQFYKSVDRQQNWKWNFSWEGKKYSFETFPPGYMASVELVNGDQRVPVQNRALGNALVSVVEITNQTFNLNPVLLYAPEIGTYHFTLKTADASKTVLRCDFAADQRSLSIPSIYLQKLAVGEYIATLALDTVQIHYKDGAAYPPWLISAQDWVYFKLNKKM